MLGALGAMGAEGHEAHRALQNDAFLLVLEGGNIHDDLHHAVLESQRCPYPGTNKAKSIQHPSLLLACAHNRGLHTTALYSATMTGKLELLQGRNVAAFLSSSALPHTHRRNCPQNKWRNCGRGGGGGRGRPGEACKMHARCARPHQHHLYNPLGFTALPA